MLFPGTGKSYLGLSKKMKDGYVDWDWSLGLCFLVSWIAVWCCCCWRYPRSLMGPQRWQCRYLCAANLIWLKTTDVGLFLPVLLKMTHSVVWHWRVFQISDCDFRNKFLALCWFCLFSSRNFLWMSPFPMERRLAFYHCLKLRLPLKFLLPKGFKIEHTKKEHFSLFKESFFVIFFIFFCTEILQKWVKCLPQSAISSLLCFCASCLFMEVALFPQ